MIEVKIHPDELRQTVLSTALYVKDRLQSAGIPVVLDELEGMRFTAKGRLHADFTHETMVYRWMAEIDMPELTDEVPLALHGVGLFA